jgi:1-acyl-sn-glycerol-3-phosphate acyltransferase
MIGTLRMLWRVPALILWTLFLWGLRLLVWPLSLVDDARDRRHRRGLTQRWAMGAERILGMRIEIHGPPPAAPFYLVANHLSYVDIFVLQRTTAATFVAKGDMAAWPIFGWLAKSLQVIFVDRERRNDAARANASIQQALKNGEGMVIFAESRISRGLSVADFKSALIEPAIALGFPIHYATISYRTRPGALPASTAVGWWRPEPLLVHFVRLLRQPGFTATVHFGPVPLAEGDRKQRAKALTEAVRAVFVPMP